LARNTGWKINTEHTMKKTLSFLPLAVVLAALFSPASSHAQSFSIDWYKIAGGGGASTNGPFSLSGTIGQQDASGAMTGGNYSVTGGFWSIISVMQVPGAPYLNIMRLGTNVVVSWPNIGSHTLQQNANLAVTNGWAATSFNVTTANGTNSISIPSPTGNLFFRLTTP
jgi:hypothetical protein